ncbi:uncharacterized protein B0H18DRAFT_1024774 [Fomitopsis serialis]|uniref:uncharacterized protein n=1 Tax=Fomitopsis serialis TaxID=139415 RepID=UPI0020086DE5|nr:uncharacterized protein B0H18DRAFT_1024774 [Neoantrodia serialis]KAH9920310.1 hypothetical protein B0H18DRAFT_1024774 [Neoantrodia serialis]
MAGVIPFPTPAAPCAARHSPPSPRHLSSRCRTTAASYLSFFYTTTIPLVRTPTVVIRAPVFPETMASISLSRNPSSRERPSHFSIQEFSDLVSTAFNLPGASGVPPSPVSSCFDADTDDGHLAGSPRKARRSSAKAPMPSEQSPKSRSALSVLRHVRTRASAVLRPANTHLTLPSEGANHSARPSICSQRTLQSNLTASSYAFLSRPPTPIPTPRTRSPFPDLALSRSRSRTKSLTGPISFLKLPKREPGASSASPSQASAPALPDTQDLPSFFEATGYSERSPLPPAYSRPSTPAPPANAQAQSRIHTRLPPLRKAKSASTSIFRGKKSKGGCTTGANGPAGAQPQVALDWTMMDTEEYFTSPRDPPPVPPLPSSLTGRRPDSGADEDGELDVPAYVFERRGSATSTCTTSTTVSIWTSHVSDCMPDSDTSCSPTLGLDAVCIFTMIPSDGHAVLASGFAFPASSTVGRIYTPSEHGHGAMYEEDTSKIGRVLTPEPDPFAKGDVAIARGSRQDDRSARNARSAQQGWDFKDASPEDVTEEADVLQVYSRARGRGSIGRRRLPEFLMESPSPRSPVYEFPSSCSIYPVRGTDVPQSPLLAGPAARTRANLVSRFSMSTESVSSRSSFTESAEHQGLKDVDVDATFVFATLARDVAPRSPSKRATLDVGASPKAAVFRSSTSASLPPSAHARYARYAESIPVATTKRQASVRTSASEPSPRVQRPSSPFPLVCGLSDGSPNGQLGAKAGDGGDVPGRRVGIVVKDDVQYAEAFEESFVLSGEEMERIQIPASALLTEEHRAFDADDDALTPRPASPRDIDLTLTIGQAEGEWDRHTTGTSESSTESGMFFSARSSVESTRKSV